MSITYASAGNGAVATATDDAFSWHFLQEMYVHDLRAGRTIYLPTGGYVLETDFGSDPVPHDVLEAARAFAREVAAEDARRQDARKSAARSRWDAACAAIDAIPEAAREELTEANRQAVKMAIRANEGGYGYVPHMGWGSKVGREIAARHGFDPDAVIEAEKVLRA